MAEGQESLAPLFLCSHCLLLGLGALGTASGNSLRAQCGLLVTKNKSPLIKKKLHSESEVD